MFHLPASEISPSEPLAALHAHLLALSRQESSIRDRSTHLALLEFESRLLTSGLEVTAIPERKPIGEGLEKYLEMFGDRTCCFEDLRPFVDSEILQNDQRSAFIDLLRKHESDVGYLRQLLIISTNTTAPHYLFLPSSTGFDLNVARPCIDFTQAPSSHVPDILIPCFRRLGTVQSLSPSIKKHVK